MPGIFQLGKMVGSFLPSKLQRLTYDPAVAQLTTDYAKNTFPGLQQANAADLANLSSDVAQYRGLFGQMIPRDIGLLGSLANRYAQADPFSQYQQVGNYLFGQAQKGAEAIGGGATFADKLAQRQLGLADRPASSLGARFIANRSASNALPLFSQALSGIGSDFGALQSAGQQNFANTLTALGQQYQLPQAQLALSQLPIGVRQQIASGELGQISTLGQQARDITSGFREKQNPFVGFLNAADEGLQGALDTYTSLYSGGLLGGGQGIFGGAFGGERKPPPGTNIFQSGGMGYPGYPGGGYPGGFADMFRYPGPRYPAYPIYPSYPTYPYAAPYTQYGGGGGAGGIGPSPFVAFAQTPFSYGQPIIGQ